MSSFSDTRSTSDFETAETTFLSTYRPVELLQRGSEGAVWLAIPRRVSPNQSLQSQLVVVKALLDGDREIGLLQVLPEHHAFQELLDFEPFLQRWVVLPYISGCDLGYMKNNIQYPPAFVLHMMIELIEAMNELHQCGIVHEDLHEGNVLLDAEHLAYKDYPRVKIIDFGKANWVDDNAENIRDPATWVSPADPEEFDFPEKRDLWFAQERTWDIAEFAAVIHTLNHPDAMHSQVAAGRCNCNTATSREILKVREFPEAYRIWKLVKNICTEARERTFTFEKSNTFATLKRSIVPDLIRLRDAIYEPLPEDWNTSALSKSSEIQLRKLQAQNSSVDKDWKFGGNSGDDLARLLKPG